MGIFTSKANADEALSELKNNGYDLKNISVIMRNDSGKAIVNSGNDGTNVAEGALSGATTGGMIGALTGLLVGIGAVAIPGIGGLLIGGPVAVALGLSGAAATTISGAVTGVLAGGLIGGLVGLGIPSQEARIYEERVRQGDILVFIPLQESTEDNVRNILSRHDAEEVRSFSLSL